MIQKALPLAVLSAVFWVLFCRKTQKSTSHQLGAAKRRNAFEFEQLKKPDHQPAKLAAQPPLNLNQLHHQLGKTNQHGKLKLKKEPNTMIPLRNKSHSQPSIHNEWISRRKEPITPLIAQTLNKPHSYRDD